LPGGRKLDERIRQLRQLRSGTPPADTEGILRKALADRSNLVVAEAAKTAGALGLSQAIPDLLTAFDRLFEEPVKSDPKCWGKTAIVKALAQMDYSDSPPFVRGSKHVQMEPVMGGREDSAAPLRANCFLALVQCSDLTRFEVLRSLVDALSDPEDPVRIEAVRALNQLGGDESVLLLRLKARIGDREPVIIGHVFDALLNLERDRAVSFVAEYLKSANDELRDEAALALGGSRLISALNVLMETWKNVRQEEFSSVLLRAISSSRLDEAIKFLLELIRTGDGRRSAAAIEALKLHEHSEEIQTLLEQAKRDRVAAS
jgi:HEAT repeat protein